MLESILVTAKIDRGHLKIFKDHHRGSKIILHLQPAVETMNTQPAVAVQWEWALVVEIQSN